jgi:hypothetical protein
LDPADKAASGEAIKFFKWAFARATRWLRNSTTPMPESVVKLIEKPIGRHQGAALERGSPSSGLTGGNRSGRRMSSSIKCKGLVADMPFRAMPEYWALHRAALSAFKFGDVTLLIT